MFETTNFGKKITVSVPPNAKRKKDESQNAFLMREAIVVETGHEYGPGEPLYSYLQTMREMQRTWLTWQECQKADFITQSRNLLEMSESLFDENEMINAAGLYELKTELESMLEKILISECFLLSFKKLGGLGQ